MMDPPPALLAALTDRIAIEATAQSSGWPYLTHPSGLGGVRTFVSTSDPNGRFDQWMLVGLDDNATLVPSPSIMSFIGVQKKDASGQDLAKVRLHFRDYLLTQTDGTWKVELSSTLAGKCYACHGSGMRLLIATSASASINQRLLSYGLPDWNGTLDPAIMVRRSVLTWAVPVATMVRCAVCSRFRPAKACSGRKSSIS